MSGQGGFDDEDTPIMTPAFRSTEQRQALQGEVGRLRRQKLQAEAMIRQLRQELTDLRAAHQAREAALREREVFFQALQRTFVGQYASAPRDVALVELEPHEEIFFCQQGVPVLPAWHRTHTLTIAGTAVGLTLAVMACVDPGKTERRYQLYQRAEYQTAVTLMAANTEEIFRCLAEAEYALYLGQLARHQTPWTQPFRLF